MAGPSVFDLARYAQLYERRRRPFLRFAIAMFLAFTAGGAATGYFATSGSLNGFFALLVVLFAAPGAIGFIFLIPLRAGNQLATLSVDATGFEGVKRNGERVSSRWGDIGLAVNFNEVPVDDLPPGLAAVPTWWFHPILAKTGGFVGQDALDAMLSQGREAGLGVREEAFDRRRRGRPNVSVREVLLKRGAVPAPPPLAGGVLPSGTGSAAPPFTGPQEFLLRKSRPPGPGIPRPPDTEPVGSVRVSMEDVQVRTIRGQLVTYQWRSPEFSVRLGRMILSEEEAVEDPTAEWSLTIKAPKAEGWIPEAGYAALTGAARQIGIPVSTSKTFFPGVRGSTPGWILDTRIGR
jgi:hypothetical protein